MRMWLASSIFYFAVSVSSAHATTERGLAIGWGHNGYFQLNAPSELFVQIAASDFGTVGVMADGTVRGWGYVMENIPASLGPCQKVIPAYYANYAVALRRDGSVACWGTDSMGNTRPPVNLGQCIDVSANGVSYAVRQDGQAVAWGADTQPGQYRAVPPEAGIATSVYAGEGVGVIRPDGSLYCWGNSLAQFPSQGLAYRKFSPGGILLALTTSRDVLIRGGTGGWNPPEPIGKCIDIASNVAIAAVLTEEGRVISWGYWLDYSANLIPIGNSPNLGRCIQVTAGRRHVVALEYICPEDLDWNHTINAGDISLLLLAFGSSDTDADLDESGVVDAGDIALSLLAFGDCQ